MTNEFKEHVLNHGIPRRYPVLNNPHPQIWAQIPSNGSIWSWGLFIDRGSLEAYDSRQSDAGTRPAARAGSGFFTTGFGQTHVSFGEDVYMQPSSHFMRIPYNPHIIIL